MSVERSRPVRVAAKHAAQGSQREAAAEELRDRPTQVGAEHARRAPRTTATQARLARGVSGKLTSLLVGRELVMFTIASLFQGLQASRGVSLQLEPPPTFAPGAPTVMLTSDSPQTIIEQVAAE